MDAVREPRSGAEPVVVEAGEIPVRYRMEDAVRRTGLTPRSIRYYEEMGLLNPSARTAGGFRLFTEAEIARLLQIKELQTLLGFSLAEIKETLHLDAVRAELRQAWDRTSDPAVRWGLIDRAAGLAQSQVRIIDERMARLAKLRDEHQERLKKLRTMREELEQEQRGGAGGQVPARGTGHE
jgi:MerR family transcriptional regulator, repressor of the yfmOP operon